MEDKRQEEVREKLNETRLRFARLRNICTTQHISKQTIQEYSWKIKQLEDQLQKLKEVN